MDAYVYRHLHDRFHSNIVEMESQLRKRISHFPKYCCYLAQDLDFSMSNAVAIAYSGDSPKRRRLFKQNGPHWPIVFNLEALQPYDLEMVLYHELAHFMADELRPLDPCHGLMWAACCDALQLQMDMDSVNLLEGSCWIGEVTKEETQRTFEREGIQNQEEWSKIRERSCAAIEAKIRMNFSRSIQFSSLIDIIRQSWDGGAKKVGVTLPTVIQSSKTI